MKEDILKYLTYTDVDMTWGGVVSFVETQDISPGQPYPPGDHPKRYLFSKETGRILNEFQLLFSLVNLIIGYSCFFDKNSTISALSLRSLWRRNLTWAIRHSARNSRNAPASLRRSISLKSG